MPVKTDRNDARAIAQVIRVGWYRPVHIKSPVSQELRMLLTNRKTLLVKYGDIENEVRGTLRAFGLKLSGRIASGQFEKRAMGLVEDRPRLAAMVIRRTGDEIEMVNLNWGLRPKEDGGQPRVATSRCGRGCGWRAASPTCTARRSSRHAAILRSTAWRRSGVDPACRPPAIEKLADADAFNALRHDRRQALWKVRGLSEKPLRLFAAADAREGGFTPQGAEEMVTLKPLTERREEVEDYRTIQLSLRAHPLSFLREDLRRRRIVTCAELASIKDGRHVEVAGVILVRQKPGSATGVLFITIEDETGVANGILWPDWFEAQRRTVLSAAMVGLRGRLQKEGLVIHVIIDKVIDHRHVAEHRRDGVPAPTWTGRWRNARRRAKSA